MFGVHGRVNPDAREDRRRPGASDGILIQADRPGLMVIAIGLPALDPNPPKSGREAVRRIVALILILMSLPALPAAAQERDLGQSSSQIYVRDGGYSVSATMPDGRVITTSEEPFTVRGTGSHARAALEEARLRSEQHAGRRAAAIGSIDRAWTQQPGRPMIVVTTTSTQEPASRASRRICCTPSRASTIAAAPLARPLTEQDRDVVAVPGHPGLWQVIGPPEDFDRHAADHERTWPILMAPDRVMYRRSVPASGLIRSLIKPAMIRPGLFVVETTPEQFNEAFAANPRTQAMPHSPGYQPRLAPSTSSAPATVPMIAPENEVPVVQFDINSSDEPPFDRAVPPPAQPVQAYRQPLTFTAAPAMPRREQAVPAPTVAPATPIVPAPPVAPSDPNYAMPAPVQPPTVVAPPRRVGDNPASIRRVPETVTIQIPNPG